MLSPSMRLAVGVLQLPGLRRATRSGFFGALASRIHFFDRAARTAMDDGIDQVVIVGAGYDSRAWRLARPGMRFFELDHPATQADKRRRAPAGGPTYVAVDLGEHTVSEALAGCPAFDPGRRALHVVEGVTMYLTREQNVALLRDLASVAAPGSRLAVNFAAPPGTGGPVERQRQRLLRLAGRSGGEAHRFFLTAPEAAPLIDECGWAQPEVRTLRELAAELLGPTELRVDKINAVAVTVVAQTSSRGSTGQATSAVSSGK